MAVTSTGNSGINKSSKRNSFAPAIPTNTLAPTISGTVSKGSTVFANVGGWSASPTSYSYQWRRGSSNISGATSSSYTLQSADVGNAISVRITASNSAGTSAAVTSQSTSNVAPETKLSVTGTTGSPSVSSNVSIGGKIYNIYTFNGAGSISFSNSGWAEVLCVGAGGGACENWGVRGGGAGGEVFFGGVFLNAGTYAVAVGGGGGGRSGNRDTNRFFAGKGASGGAAGSLASNNISSSAGGGAGGTVWGGADTAGRPINITGSSVTYGAARNSGGGGANTGQGGGPGANAGGSGRVVVRVEV
ncbi:MAG TPA: hypothetical protein VIC08_08005 [Cellvibrionaceae bacterium]